MSTDRPAARTADDPVGRLAERPGGQRADRGPVGRDPSVLDPIAPDWLVRILAPKKAPVPWRDMTRVLVSIVAPLGLGVLLGQQALAIFVGMGALVGAFGDRGGTFGQRFARTSAGVLAGLVGLVAGQLTAGNGLLAVAVVGIFAVVSALVSAINATLSFAALQLLVYLALSGGVTAKVSVWVIIPAFLVGACWSLLMSFVQSRFDHAEDAPRAETVALLRMIATMLREPAGPDPVAGAEQRNAVSVALYQAVDVVVTTRARSSGRRADLRELNAVLTGASRLAAAAYGFSRRGEPTPELADLVDRLATAVEAHDRDWRPPEPPEQLRRDATSTAGSVRAAVARIAEAQSDPHGAKLRPVDREAHRLQRYAVLLFGRTAWTFAARLGTTMVVAEIVRQLVPVQKPYWILLTAALVLKPDLGSVFARGLQRTLGTLVGVLVGAVVLQLVPVGGWMLLPIAVLAFGFPLAMSRNYGMLSTFITPLVFLLLDFAAPVSSSLVLARLADTALGAGIVLVVGYLCWPSTWRPRLGRTVADATAALADYVRVAFGDDWPASGAARRRAYRALSDVRAALQSALAEPPPLSTRAAAWWPLIAQLERAVDRTSHAVLLARHAGEHPDPTDVNEVVDALEDLGAALRERRPPRNLTLPEDGPLDLAAHEVAAARRVVARGS
ncbi:putative membrane protein YccC [Friedmanniella endophytica]|uniref:Putative membrane protein YccC n=1 Tax=Microlunatus kandeliicorticis TaxID=1759536 RepID=A0A7W3IQB3_9ACTN|nr:FUSC family protein [Microlunatus kandeliicorticis]MBA8793282.1 putative membrane protein YccC [Microlunatus kandeliicorticis]